ncbi:MAG: hypothetical protein QM731_22415 [Chitinophagaceae bacterium]
MKKLLLAIGTIGSLGFTTPPANYQPPGAKIDRPNHGHVITREYAYIEVTNNDCTVIVY